MTAMNRALGFALVCLMSAMSPAGVQAQSSAPAFSKVFSPDTIGPDSVSTLTYTITNANATPVTDLAFTDTLPTSFDPMRVALGESATTCTDATLTAVVGTQTVSLSGGKLGAFATCTVTVTVEAGDVADTLTSTTGDLTSSAGNSGTASDDLTISTSLPGFSKSFAPSSIPLGGTSTLTFTIDNTANTGRIGTLDFTDILPAGVVVASPANAGTDCISPTLPDTTLTAVPGSGSIVLDANGFDFSSGFQTLDAGATCTVSVDVTGAGVGTHVNSASLLAQGVDAGKATAALTVTGAPAGTLQITKDFIDDPAFPGGTVTLEFSITNLDRANDATSVAFTDDLNAALAGLTYASVLSNSCGGTVPGVNTTSVSLSGGTIAPGGQCSLSVALTVPGTAAAGTYTNSTSAVTGVIDGVPVTGNQASNTLTVIAAAPLTFAKDFVPDAVAAGGDVVVRYTITNPNSDGATDIAFIDELTDPTGASPVPMFDTGFLPFPVTADLAAANPACGGTVALVSVGLDRQGLELTGGTLAPGGSCTFDVTVTIPAALPGGTYTDRSDVLTATVLASTVTSAAASDTLTVSGGVDLSISKSFSAPAAPGGTVDLTFVITNGSESATVTDVAFTDDLAAVLTGLTAGAPSANSCGGSMARSAGDTLLSYSGGTLAEDESCEITVPVSVPASAASGDFTNTTSDLTATGAGQSLTFAPASAELTVSGLKFSKAFAPTPAIAGQTVTLTYSIQNAHPTDDATISSFSDNLADILPGATDVTLASVGADSCGGSFITTTAGTTFLFYSGGSVSSGQTCTIAIDVLVPAAAPDGDYNSVTSSLSANQNGGVTVAPASATLTVQGNVLQLTKTFLTDPVAPGADTTLEFTLTNLDDTAVVTDIDFTDDLNAMLSGATMSSADFGTCGGTVSGTGTGLVTFAGGTLAAEDSCTFQVGVSVPGGAAAGTYSNTTSDVTGSIATLDVFGDPASATLRVSTTDTLFSKSFDSPVGAGGTATLTFAITNPNAGTVSGLSFSDNLDSMLSGAVATSLPDDPCGAGSLITGTGNLRFEGGTLAGGATCSFDVEIAVPVTATPGDYPNTTTDLTAGGVFSAAPATASLQIEPPPTFAKAFGASAIGVGQDTTLTFTIDNSASALAAASLDFTDSLPAGVQVATTPAAATTCTGGTVTAAAGSGSITYSGGSVAAGASCTVAVDVTGTAAGSQVNTTGDLTSSTGNSGTASATLDVIPQPLFDKDFAPATISLTDSATLTFTIDNTAVSLATTSLSFTDDLPAGLVVAATPNASTTCTGGTLTAVASSGSVQYSGGSVTALGSCTVSVDVTPASAGTFDNISGALTSVWGSSGTAAATLTVTTPEIDVAGDIGGAVAAAGTLPQGDQPAGTQQTLTLTVTNNGTEALTLVDPVVSSLVNVTVDNTPAFLALSVAPGDSTTVEVQYTPTVAGAFSFDLSIANNDVDENPYAITVSGTGLDVTAPAGYSVSLDQDPVNAAGQTAASFTFAGAEVGATFDYEITSSGGGTPVSGSGTIAAATDQVTGLDLSGLGDGTLTLTATLTDAALNTGLDATDTAEKDTTAPTGYTVAFDQDPVNAANQAAMSVSFAGAEVGATFAYAITSDGGGTPVTGTGTIATGADAVTGLDLSGLADGTLTVTATLTDPAGNTGADASDTATKDATAPGASFDTPIAGDGTVNAAEAPAVTLSGTASGVLDGAIVTVAVSDGAVSVSDTATVAAGAWSLTLDLTTLADGPLSLTADVSDAAGNPAPQATAAADKDTVAPVLAIDTPIAGDDIVNAAEAPAVTLSGTATGLADGATVNVNVSHNGGASVVVNSTTVAGGVWSLSADLSAVVDGPITVIANASDAAGNPATPATAAATKDATLPTVTLDTPIAGDDLINAAEAPAVTLSGTSTDLPDGTTVTVVVSDGAAGSVTLTPTVSGGLWSVVADLSALADGPLSVTADGFDIAGNAAVQATASVVKDTVAPAGYAATFDQDPVNLGNQAAAGFTFAGAEPGASYAYSITSDGGGAPVTGTGTLATATDQLTALDLSGLGDGTLTLTVALTDAAGNTGADATDTAAKDTVAPTATLSGPITAQSGAFTVDLTFSEPVTGLALVSIDIDNGSASALTGSGAVYSLTVTPDHDGPIEISLLAGAAADAGGNLSLAAGPLLAVAHLTGVPNPFPLPDADGDGIPDILESAFNDADNDGIPDSEDFDPQGYFYCEDDGRIIPGGSFSVSGPLGSNSSLGIANGINITRDGSSGEIQWFALVPGTFTMSLTYPTAVGLPSTARLSSGTLDMTTLLPANPAYLGSSESGSSGFLADASLAANPVFYTSFTIEPGDPFVLSNNIPMTQCATNAVNLTASTDGAEANGGAPTDVTFTVTQDRLSTQDTVVSLALTGTATAGADYTAPAATVTIPAGATTATVTVPVLEDNIVEGTETVIATLTAITSGDLSTVLGTTLAATASITDDDFADILVTNVDLVTSEGGGDDASMTFVLLGAPTAPVTLSFAGDSQCSVSPATMTFTPADFDTAQTLTIRAKDDDKVEGTHSCQPTVTVASADAGFDSLAVPLATVTVTDDLVDQIREPLTQILEEDLKDTIDTQQRAFSRMAKGALSRLQEGQDLPCGTLSAFDVDGSLEIKDATGTATGTFGRDTYNCATDTREIVDGSFSLNKSEDTGVQAMLQFAFQREKFISDREIAGYFVGGYFSRTDVSGLGEGDITGFGVNGGVYGARGISDSLFLDYYLAGAAGHHRFDIDFDAALAPINARGSYGYLAGFAGIGLSGQHAFDSFVMKPRVALDLAYARAGDADVTARQLGLTHTGVIDLDDFSGMRATAEITFESLAAPGGSDALAARMRTAITPRLTCTLNSYDSDAECGVGLALAWERTNSASGLTFGFEIDAERIEDDSSLTFNIKRERPILNGAGAVVTRLSMPQAQTWQVEHGVKVDF